MPPPLVPPPVAPPTESMEEKDEDVSQEGDDICCNVHYFEPNFYVSCVGASIEPYDVPKFRSSLEARMRETKRNSKSQNFITTVEIAQTGSVMSYRVQKAQQSLKIFVASPTMVAGCRGILEKGINIDGIGQRRFWTYEGNVPFALRCVIDGGIVGGNWVELPAGTYCKSTRQFSYCQLEVDIHYNKIVSHSPVGQYSEIAPIRILNFDIESAGRSGHFPDSPEHDPVSQITNLMTGQGEERPLVKNAMAPKSCSSIVDADVMSSDAEKEVLQLAWGREKKFNVGEISLLGRIRNSRIHLRDASFSSRHYGTTESKEVDIEGRDVQFGLQATQRDCKLLSSLNSAPACYLGPEQKEGMHHCIILDLQNRNSGTCPRLTIYTVEVYLPNARTGLFELSLGDAFKRPKVISLDPANYAQTFFILTQVDIQEDDIVQSLLYCVHERWSCMRICTIDRDMPIFLYPRCVGIWGGTTYWFTNLIRVDSSPSSDSSDSGDEEEMDGGEDDIHPIQVWQGSSRTWVLSDTMPFAIKAWLLDDLEFKDLHASFGGH